MAINFPGSLDNFTNPTSASPINSPSHADQHANANDAIEALEAKVGVDGSSVVTSHDYKIAQLQSLVTSAVAGAKSIYQDVRNQSGSAFTKATPVYVSGSTGASGQLLVSAASNAAEATSSKTMGITTSAISNNSNGQVISEGILEGIDTTGAADGDPVWLGVNGAKIYGLANKPSAPAHLVFLGIVIRGGQANTGSMYVKIQNGFELHELHNVEVSSLVNGNILAYDSTTQTWKNTNTLQSTSSTIPLVIKGAASQTADYFQIQNSNGTVLAQLNSSNQFNVNYGSIYTSYGIRAGSNNHIGLASVSAFSINAAYLALGVKAYSGQTADLVQNQNSSGTVLSGINAAGQIYGGKISSSVYGSTSSAITIASFNSTTVTYNSNNTYATNPYSPGSTVTISGFTPAGYNGTFVIQSVGGTSGAYTFTCANTTNAAVTVNAGIVYLSPIAAFSGTSPFTIPLVVQGAALQTTNLQEWQSSANAVLARVSNTGIFVGGAFSSDGSQAAGPNIASQFGTTSATRIPLVVYGASSQTADLQQWQNSAGTILAKILSNGGATITGNTWLQGGLAVQGNYGGTNTMVIANNQNIIGLTIKGTSTQTANLQEWQNSAGTVLSAVNALGQGVFTNTTPITASAVSQAITAVSFTSTTATYTFSATAQTISVGEYVTVFGITPSGYNGTYQVTAVATVSAGTSYSFTVANNTNATVTVGTGYFFPSASVSISTQNKAHTGLIIKAVSGQTASTMEIQNSLGQPVTWWDSTGGMTASQAVVSTLYSGGFMNTGTLGYFNATTFNASTIPVVVRGAASQTADLQQWQDSSGTVLASLSPTLNSAVALNFTSNYSIKIKWGGSTILYTDPSPSTLIASPYSTDRIGFIVRGLPSQTADLQQWQNSSGTVLAKVDASGNITSTSLTAIGGTSQIGTANFYTNGNVVISNTLSSPYLNISYAATIGGAYNQLPLLVKAVASQTANLQEWQDSNGNALALVNSSGAIITGGVARATNGGIFGGTTQLSSAGLTVYTTAAGNPGAIIRGTASQTADLQQWQDSAGTNVLRMTAYGKLFSNYLQSNYGILTGGAIYAGGYNFISNPTFGTADVTFIVKAVTSQTSNLQEWHDSSGTAQAYIGVNGFINTNNSLRVAGDNISAYRFQGVSDGLYTMNFPGSGNIQLFSATNDTGSGVGVLGIKNATTAPTSNPTTGGILYVSSGALLYRGTSNASQQIIGADGSVKFTSPTASIPALIIKGATSQSSNLFEIKDANNNNRVYVDANGSLAVQNITSIRETWGGIALDVSGLNSNSNPIQSWNTVDSNGDNKTLVAKIDKSGQIFTKSVIGNTSSTISTNTASTVDTVALSSFTSMEYILSIKQGSKIRSSKILVHTDGTSVDSTEYGIMEMGGGITGILVTASVSSTNAILQVTITDAATTNATVKLIKTML